jgi:hypothetical protein
MAIGSNPCGCAEGIGTCEEAWACIQTHICQTQGLTLSGGCLGVALGACLGFDAQGRIAYICGDVPEPGPCQATVDTLLADGFFVGGRRGGTGHVTGWGSPQGIDYALSMGLPLIEVDAFASFDEVLVWSGASRDVNWTIWTNSVAASAYERTSVAWMGTISDPGTPANRIGRYKMAPAAQITPDGGYLGYGMPQFSLMLGETGLRRVNGRAVVNLDLSYGQTTSAALYGSRAVDVAAAIRAISVACAQEWTIVTVSPAEMATQVPTVVNAGLTACVAINNNTTITPAEVTATGATWVRLRDTLQDARITSFVTAGLNVLLHTNSRQVETVRAENLGVAGIVADDPVYARDEFPMLPAWTATDRASEIGILDYFTDQTQAEVGRGYTRDAQNGLWIPQSPAVVSAIPQNGTTTVIHALTLGMERFNAASVPAYTYNFGLRPEWTSRPTNTAPYAGLIVSAVEDVDFSAVPTGLYGTRYPSRRTGYLCVVRISNGQMLMFRFDGTSIPSLATSGTNVTLSTGVVSNFSITVTSTGITFANTGGGPSITANDATYRGRYSYAVASNARTGAQSYEVGFTVDPTV